MYHAESGRSVFLEEVEALPDGMLEDASALLRKIVSHYRRRQAAAAGNHNRSRSVSTLPRRCGRCTAHRTRGGAEEHGEEE